MEAGLSYSYEMVSCGSVQVHSFVDFYECLEQRECHEGMHISLGILWHTCACT